MKQLIQKLDKEMILSFDSKQRLKMAQKRNNLIISRNKCDVALEDVSATKERKIKQDKRSSTEAFQTISIQVQLAKRRSQDEALIEKRLLQKQRLEAYGLAHAKAIMQDYPDIMRQSIEYLTNLAEQAQISVRTKNTFNKVSIAQYYTQLFTKGATNAFYKHSTALLNQRILDIIKEFHQSQLQHPPQINIQIQILAHLFKNILQFQRYLPKQVQTHTLYIKMTAVTQLFKLTSSQISQLRRIYLQNSPRITYLEDFNLRFLANAYYFIMLKQKVLSVKYSVQLDDEIKIVVEKLKIHRAQVMKMEKFRAEIKGEQVLQQSSLSELYARRQAAKKCKDPRDWKLLQTISTYERLIEMHQLTSITGDEKKKQMAQLGEVNYDYFKKYQSRKRKLLEKNGNNLSKMKDELITKQLIRDPYCSYEKVFNNIYYRNALYIERSYFEGNIHRLLEKETHYQQFRYLEKVFKGAIECKGKANVLFIDRYSLIEGRESNVIVTVSLAGALHYEKSPDSMHFLKQVKGLLKTQQSSVVLIFDDEFPFSARLEETEEAFLIRKIHSLCFLPRVSLVPNPCMAIVNNLKQIITEQCSLEEALQTMLKRFDRPKVVEVAQKEWEKAERLVYPDNFQCKQQQKANKEEWTDSNIEKGLDLQDNQDEEEDKKEDEDENEEGKFLFPRDSKDGFSSPNPQPLIMENLSERSASDLQLALTRLLQLNKRSSFPKKN